MNKIKLRRREEQQLNKQLQNAYLVFQNDPSEENLVALNVLKERMDKMYKEEEHAGMNMEKRTLGTFST